jgi:hypothetical protein
MNQVGLMTDQSTVDAPRERLWLVLALAGLACLATILLRLHPPMYNFTPVGALCLFLGARVRSIWGLAIPMLLMLGTDYLVWQSQPTMWQSQPALAFLHTEMVWVYGSLTLMFFMGWCFLGRDNPLAIVGAAIAGGLPFFLITNFSSWYNVAIAHTVTPTAIDNYSPDLFGLLTCYGNGLVFHRGMLFGDLLFSGVLFGSYALAVRRLDARQPAAVPGD